jgi:hypothetical protein
MFPFEGAGNSPFALFLLILFFYSIAQGLPQGGGVGFAGKADFRWHFTGFSEDFYHQSNIGLGYNSVLKFWVVSVKIEGFATLKMHLWAVILYTE